MSGDRPGYEADIRCLFRQIDRESMDYVFDLWSYQDVRENAIRILERLEEGTMPCDHEWPAEHISLFRLWIDAGMEE